MRRPDDSDDVLALSTSFDHRPPMTRRVEITDPVVSNETCVVPDDGVRLALKRYTPRKGATTDTSRNPVILCHGLAGNSTPFDLRAQNSLAWALARQGHTVWLVNLRGAGESDRPATGWTLDDYIHKDVPAIIHHVRRAHFQGGDGGGGGMVHWCGHSLGGIVGLCALAAVTPSLQPYVQTVTTLGSALDYEESAWKRFAPLVPMSRLIPNHDKVVLPESLTPALLSMLSVYPYFLCADKINKDALAALQQCLEPVSLGVMQHLATAIQTGGLAVLPPSAPSSSSSAAATADPNGASTKSPRTTTTAPAAADTLDQPLPQPQPQRRYLQLMGRVRTPVMAICGDRDVQCGERAVLRMLEALGSVRRRFVLVGGGGEGGKQSYGHMDLLLKESAAVDVFPYVCEWVAAAEAGGWGPGEFEEGVGEQGMVEEMKVADSDDGRQRRRSSLSSSLLEREPSSKELEFLEIR